LQDSPIQIGAIGLQGFEIPSSVRFGGRYRLAVHNLSGGRRIVERLGPDDGEISFQGTFSGPNAEARVRAFDSLRLSGDIVWLTWGSFRHRVVVKSFVAEYRSPWWIPYKVSCVVAHQAAVAAAQTSTLSALISADLGNALSSVSNSTISLASLQTALSSTNALVSGTSDQVQAVAAVGAALDVINSQITTQSQQLIAPIDASTDPNSFSQALATTVNSAGLLATAVNAGCYVGRIGTNLNGSGN
jgi:hypothetical protein